MSAKKVVAVCGKGGVGKTAFTAMLTHVLAGRPETGKLLVVDADPALGLNYALGRKTEKTIGSVRDRILETAEGGNRKEVEALADKIDYLVAQSLDEGEKFSFIAMGHMDAKGCFCSINGLLRDALDQVSSRFDTILIDGEAGIEQINRQVVENIDTLILVTDTSLRGMQTVRHIKGLVDDGYVPACKTMGVVFNRTQSDVSAHYEFARELGVKVLGTVPYDKDVEVADLKGISLMELPEDNPALAAVRAAYEKTL